MKKYFTVLRLAFMDTVEYRTSLILRTARYAGGILLLSLVWLAINATHPLKEMSQVEIIRYYFLTAIVYALSNYHTDYIEEDIRLGYISKYLVKPISAFWFYCLKQGTIAFVETTIKIVFMLPILFFLAHGLPWTPLHFLMFLTTLPVIFLMVFSLYFTISITAFWFQAVESLRMSIMFLFRFLSGIFVPLTLLPLWFINMSHWLPFAQAAYFPIQLLEGKLSANEMILVFISLLFWLVCFFSLQKMIWNYATHSYESTGI